MKQEDKWKVDAGNQQRRPDTALRKPPNINSGVLEKSLRQKYPYFFLFRVHVQSLCAKENCFKCVHNWKLLAKVNPFI